jgi:uncharacterized protein (DUF302 family)
MDNTDVLRWESAGDVPTTAKNLQAVLSNAGVTVFAVIDQQKYAQATGLHMNPLVEILFGNPQAGTPLMQANPLCAFDLPLKALVVSATDGRASVLMLAPKTISGRYGISEEVASAVVGGASRLIELAVADVSNGR